MAEKVEKVESDSSVAVTVQRAAMLSPDEWTAERIATIKRTICPDATTAELAMFLAVCQQFDLNPLVGEIWLGKDDRGQPRVFTGRNSFLKVARRDSDFGGMIHGTVCEKDAFSVERSGENLSVDHTISSFNRGPLVGGYCHLKLHGRPDVFVMRRLDQYKHLGGKSNWKNYPEEMLETRCIVLALRYAFNLAGVAMPEETDVTTDDGGARAIEEATSTRSIPALRARLEQLNVVKEEVEARPLVDVPAGATETVEHPEFERGDADESDS